MAAVANAAVCTILAATQLVRASNLNTTHTLDTLAHSFRFFDSVDFIPSPVNRPTSNYLVRSDTGYTFQSGRKRLTESQHVQQNH